MILPMRSLLPALLLVAACGTTTRFVATNPSPHPLAARAPSTVDIYTTGTPQVAYVEVGILQARQSSKYSLDDMPEIVSKMRAEAAQIGCDGVVLNGASDKTVGSGDQTSSSTTTLEGYWGACIVYLGADDGAPGETAAR
jgi:hypothetical protein